MVYYLFATFNISWIRYMLNEKGLQFKLVAVRKCLNAMTRMSWWWIQVQLNVCLFFMESTYGFLFLIMTLILKYLPLFWLGFWLGVRTCSNRLWTFPIVFVFIENLAVWCQMGLSDATWHIFPEIDKKTADVSKNITQKVLKCIIENNNIAF